MGIVLSALAILPAIFAQEVSTADIGQPSSLSLLKEAEAVSGNFPPEERTDLLLDLAKAMKRVDKGLAESWARQVFATASSLPEGQLRSATQKNAIVILADLNPVAAAELFQRQDLPPQPILSEDIRSFGTRSLFPKLWSARKMAALPVIEEISVWLGSTGSYPYTAMTQVIVSVAESDPEKAKSLFSQAVSFLGGDPYLTTPKWYVDFLLGTSKVVTGPQMVEAIAAGLTSIDKLAKRPDARKTRFELSAGKSTVRMESEAEMLVYRLLPLMASLDVQWPKRVMERYANLASLPGLELGAAVQTSGVIVSAGNSDPGLIQATMDESKLHQLLSLAEQDPGAAWKAAFQIGNPDVRAIALATLLPRHSEEDPEDAKSWLAKLAKIADSLDASPRKLRLWSQLAVAYFSRHEEQDAERFMNRAFDLGQELFAQSRRENPGVMAYQLIAFDELVALSETAGASSTHVANVLSRVRQVGEGALEGHMLVGLAGGLATRSDSPKTSLP